MKYFKRLYGTPQEMISQVLQGSWADKVKSNALDAIYQYAEFIGVPVKKVKRRLRKVSILGLVLILFKKYYENL